MPVEKVALRALSFAPTFFLEIDAALALEAAVLESSAPSVTSAYRTREQQEYLYRLWISGKGNLAAKPGTSRHEFGRALDARGTAEWADAMERHGWARPIAAIEPWHWEYTP